jgi:membrane-bound lytic murein transglycosylase MltF
MNTKKLLNLLAFLLFIIVVIILSSSMINYWNKTKSKRDLPQIMKDKVLNIVTEYNSVDFHAIGDSVGGIQYDLSRYIAQRSGLKIKIYLENDLETAVWKLENNECDVIAQNIPITTENNHKLAFTIPITQSKQVLVQRKQSDTDSTLFITNQLDLGNKTIYITKNSPVILRLSNLAEEIAEPINIEEIAGYTSEQLIYMVDKREIDYTVVDKEIALQNAKLFPDLDYSTDISFTQLQAWALRKNATILLDSLNLWITAFKHDIALNKK